jgi:hypothetical protein
LKQKSVTPGVHRKEVIMSAAFPARFVASCLALAAVTGCTGGGGNPVTPSDSGGATIAGTVSRSTGPLGLTVAVVGTDLSAVADTSGYFQIGRVPSGNVQLKFKDATIDATAQLLNVIRDEFIEIQVQVNGGSAVILNESRSSGKVSLCHRTGNGEYHLIDVSVNAEPAHRAHGDGKVGEPVPGTQRQVLDASCRPVGPAVKIEKSTNGEDADNAPGPSILVGSAVTWRYVVTNTGTINLTGIVVADDRGVLVNCSGQTTLPAGQAMTCTGAGVATLGQYSNIGKVTAASASGAVDDSDSSHYLGVPQPPPPIPQPPPPGEMTICHIPPGNYNARHTITIGVSAWPAHQGHCAQGTCDYVGPCR